MRGALLAPILVLAAVAAPSSAGNGTLAHDDPALADLLAGLGRDISGSRIYDCIASITTDIPASYRLMGTPTHDLFVQTYGGVFGDLGLKHAVVHFDNGGPGVGTGLPTGGDNILGVLPGEQRDRWLVIGGHYDTRELTFGGGALDNTAGICTVQEIARAIVATHQTPRLSVVFAWWDGEEWGLFGARAFVKDPNATKELLGLPRDAHVDIVAALSFDMPGLNFPAYNTWVQYGDPAEVLEVAALNLRTAPANPENLTLCPSYGCYTRLKDRADFDPVLANFTNFQALVREIGWGLLGLPPKHVWVYDDQYGRSDHVPFIAAGIPGMRIQGSHDEEYPHYHQPTDTIPGLIALAGSEENLKAGFDTAADAGGLTGAYVAFKGSVGDYGRAVPSNESGAAKDAPASKQVPALAPGAALAGLALAAVALRRRA